MFKEGDSKSDTSVKPDAKTGATEDDTPDDAEDSTEEDTVDESDDSDDESDDTDASLEKEDETEGRALIKKYFADPASIPKELRGSFKVMQGNYTRAMQGAADNKKKASAFDQLVLDPEFRAWADARMKGKGTTNLTTKDTSDDDDTEDTPVTKKDLKTFMASMEAKINSRDSAEEDRRAAAKFKKDNPDWEIYKEPMLEILSKHPTLTYEDAYELASKKDKRLISKKESIDSKKKANINKPNRTGAKDGDEENKKPSFKDAYHAAKKKLGL